MSTSRTPELTAQHKVLVVDTDLRILRALAEELRRRGLEPLEASSFEEAKRLWLAERPAMLIADVRLGQFNGLQLLVRARAERPDVKAVITCSFADKVLESETTRFGGTFLVKPLTPEQVAEVLRPGRQLPSSVERRFIERRQLPIPNFVPDRRVGGERRRVDR